MKVRKDLIREIKKQKGAVHIVLIGTKPDIIKQAPLIIKLKEKNHFTLVIHSGQHNQFNLSGGLEKEFGIVPDVNLEVSGNLYQQQSQIIERFGSILEEIKSLKKEIIPYNCADTTTAVAAGIASFANLISTAHVEAGLRTMSPSKELTLSLLNDSFNPQDYFEKLKESKNWEKGSYEPYPEQFDTRAAGPSAGIHFAPTKLNMEHLINEGYSPQRIFVVGNTISDALKHVKKSINKSTIFEKFPILVGGNVIRFCVHRRENISSFQRFMSIYEAMEQLIRDGRKIILISLGATEKALRQYGLKNKTLELSKKYKNFIYSPVLPYYYDTIALMQKCSLVVTDSGSIQEETNMLGIPGVVLRFNTDRPEAVFSGSNVIAPPIKKEIILKIINAVLDSKERQKIVKNSKKLYGENVSGKIVKTVEKAIHKDSSFNIFEFMEHQRLGLTKKSFWRKGGIQW
ncbi:MAG: UDP-N-acetylglucosamine 2-epimerase [Candidatus Levybacteria bacterium]|nr:UDP-N-acetylglucosamine 2-epimerase [Candidatus Levybacteria bacterium]